MSKYRIDVQKPLSHSRGLSCIALSVIKWKLACTPVRGHSHRMCFYVSASVNLVDEYFFPPPLLCCHTSAFNTFPTIDEIFQQVVTQSLLLATSARADFTHSC